MKRDFLTDYLYEKGCNPDNEDDSDVSQLWRNCINGETCYIPYADDLDMTTYCHVFYELKVTPPDENDDEYQVYSGWRNKDLKEALEKSK